MRDVVFKQVKLVQFNEEDVQAATREIERLLERYGVPGQDQDLLWKAFACFCTHLLLEKGELPGPDVIPDGD
jgi:hypothetical protein